MSTSDWLVLFLLLLGIIGYFLKRIMDNTDRVTADVAEMKPKLDLLWAKVFSDAKSPRQLNDEGKRVLSESGIEAIITRVKPKLVEIIKSASSANPYDAEKVIMATMANLPQHCPEVVADLKQGAFQSGVDISAVLWVGGLHLRDLIFPELGFNLEDLDKPLAS